jgi:hypothetical protein
VPVRAEAEHGTAQHDGIVQRCADDVLQDERDAETLESLAGGGDEVLVVASPDSLGEGVGLAWWASSSGHEVPTVAVEVLHGVALDECQAVAPGKVRLVIDVHTDNIKTREPVAVGRPALLAEQIQQSWPPAQVRRLAAIHATTSSRS